MRNLPFFEIVILFAVILPIQAMANESKAILLVIDMQESLLTPGKGGLHLDSSEVQTLINNVNDNIRSADSLKIPVAYIQNEWTNPLQNYFTGNICRKGAPGTGFDSRLLIVDSLVFHKSVGNSFSNKELVGIVAQDSIKTIYIAGIKAEGCVGFTARASMKRGFKTILIVGAIGSNTRATLQKRISNLVRAGAQTTTRIQAPATE